MMERKSRIGFFLLFLSVPCLSLPAKETLATIIYDDKASLVSAAELNRGELWVSNADLKLATGFELKPQGVCRDELCFPVPGSEKQQLTRSNAGTIWFNLTGFARLVDQPVAHDPGLATWYFGLRSDQRQGLSALQAPDFTLPDRNGKSHSLSDFRGKKVLLLTWASW
jgi:hypothetical protein